MGKVSKELNQTDICEGEFVTVPVCFSNQMASGLMQGQLNFMIRNEGRDVSRFLTFKKEILHDDNQDNIRCNV